VILLTEVPIPKNPTIGSNSYTFFLPTISSINGTQRKQWGRGWNVSGWNVSIPIVYADR